MERDDDVERLFSWLKTPDLRYREFAGERDVADAASTWPVMRDTVIEPLPAEENVVEAQAAPPAAAPAPPSSPREPLSERLRAVLGRTSAPRNGQTFHDVVIPPDAEEPAPPTPHADIAPLYEEPRREPPAPAAAPGFELPDDEPAVPPPPRSEFPGDESAGPTAAPQFEFPGDEPAVPPPPRSELPAGEREALFGGSYRGFENDDPAPAPVPPPAEQQGGRSLDEVFSRLAQAGSGYHHERKPRSGSSGLGPVFRRLR